MAFERDQSMLFSSINLQRSLLKLRAQSWAKLGGVSSPRRGTKTKKSIAISHISVHSTRSLHHLEAYEKPKSSVVKG